MEKCNYCNHIIQKSLIDHSCRPKRYFEKYIKYDDIISQLVNQGYSLLYISNNSEKLLGEYISRENIVVSCNRSNTHMPTISESKKSKITQQHCKETLEQKYGSGIINVSQVPEVKEKKKKSNQDRYGVDNPFQREEIKEQSKQTMLLKYGVENPIHIPNKKGNKGKVTIPHKKISDYLTQLNIAHLNEHPGNFRKFNSFLNRVYSPIPDIYIPNKNLIFEIYGTRWHMDPRFFYETDVVRFFCGFRSGKDTWETDKDRIEHLESFGVNVIILWEHDIKTDFPYIQQLIRENVCKN